MGAIGGKLGPRLRLVERPAAVLNPALNGEENWVGGGRFRRPDPDGKVFVDEAMLAKARDLSQKAAGMETNGRDAEGAASLRLRASEMKRVGGAPAEAYADHVALTAYHLERGIPKAAIAYMRKAVHVAKLDVRPEIRTAGHLFGAATYLSMRLRRQAVDMAREAYREASAAGLAPAMAEAKAIEATAMTFDHFPADTCVCAKPKARFAQCCGLADHDPVEFSPEALSTRESHSVGAFETEGYRAIETLMDPPDDCYGLSWYAWRVEDGVHSLMAYTDWSGRALRSARRLAELARTEPHPGPTSSSAVLQAYVALEAFLTSWKAHVERMVPKKPGKQRKKKGAPRVKGQPKFVREWQEAATAMFGAWSNPDVEAFTMLALLRNRICHDGGATETLLSASKEADDLLEFLVKVGRADASRTSPSVERLLVPAVADWAVEVAEAQIAAVRRAWWTMELPDKLFEWRIGAEQDIADVEEDTSEDTDLADEVRVPAADSTRPPSGLRMIKRRLDDADQPA